MTLADLSPLANHLWQSTLFAIAVWLLTLALRKNRASARYWLWFAASVKFLIPFSFLVGIGSRFAWRSSQASTLPQFANVMNQISRPLVILPNTPIAAAPLHASSALPLGLLAVWFCGGVVVLIFWLRSLRQIRAIKRAAAALRLGLPIPVMSSAARMEPGVFGILNPVLILPEGITDRLTPAQFKAVLAHELCHVRRRDNLTAAIHMVVEVIFWFHPLVWWIRTQLVAERERVCDESVLGIAEDPQTYAEAILNVCRLYMESPLRCVSSVSGADLKRRIRAIATGRIGGELTLARKAVLALAATVALAIPILAGAIGAPSIRAQSQTQNGAALNFEFEVASIKPTKPGQVGMSMDSLGTGTVTDTFIATNIPLIAYIREAYGMSFGAEDGRVLGAPAWVNSERYDIEAKIDRSVVDSLNKLNPRERTIEMQQMLQKLLANRFGLAVHRETRDLSVYSLVVAKNGPKLQEAKPEDSARSGMGLRGRGGPLVGRAVPMPVLAEQLSALVNRIVLDKTGLTGKYNFTMQWTPDEGQGPNYIKDAGSTANGQPGPGAQDPSGPSIFTALQDQLGLKLESGKGPIEVIVIDHVERPSGN
ncbi:MAG TPA: M56 and DUF3738 domain-containing protein [Candidatus Acidoferrum sp.]|nr:M56 and DUF3738 domain-containing protein [Candidatus Acidoferrum sp.]